MFSTAVNVVLFTVAALIITGVTLYVLKTGRDSM